MHTPFIRQQCYMDCHNILQNGEGEKRMKQQPPPSGTGSAFRTIKHPLTAVLSPLQVQYQPL